jgi:hypothetical protein
MKYDNTREQDVKCLPLKKQLLYYTLKKHPSPTIQSPQHISNDHHCDNSNDNRNLSSSKSLYYDDNNKQYQLPNTFSPVHQNPIPSGIPLNGTLSNSIPVSSVSLNDSMQRTIKEEAPYTLSSHDCTNSTHSIVDETLSTLAQQQQTKEHSALHNSILNNGRRSISPSIDSSSHHGLDNKETAIKKEEENDDVMKDIEEPNVEISIMEKKEEISNNSSDNTLGINGTARASSEDEDLPTNSSVDSKQLQHSISSINMNGNTAHEGDNTKRTRQRRSSTAENNLKKQVSEKTTRVRRRRSFTRSSSASSPQIDADEETAESSDSEDSSNDKEGDDDEDKEEEEEEDGKIYCICKQPYKGRWMIACDLCNEWYHGRCVSVTSQDAKRILQYICPPCREKTGKETVFKVDRRRKSDSTRAKSSTLNSADTPSERIQRKRESAKRKKVIDDGI